MKPTNEILINNRLLSLNSPTYFIADVASNHDGDLTRAKELIWLCKDAGADAVKFQHFKAEKIVSDWGFKTIPNKDSHQSDWGKSVFDTYKQYEVLRDWNIELINEAKSAGIDFFTTPYDMEAVEQLDQYVPAYKIGSGDITWIEFIESIAKREKPVMLATGASNLEDVKRAVNSILRWNQQLVLMQCNTNYTGSLDNFKYINLNVLKTYASLYPEVLLGLSDHTPGHSTVLGAIAMGARAIEKHFTDDNKKIGPDHEFSMNPSSWSEMIQRSRELEYALGNGVKKVEDNEKETVIIQRRGIYLKNDLPKGSVISREDIEFLRPLLQGAYYPYEIEEILQKTVQVDKYAGEAVFKSDIKC